MVTSLLVKDQFVDALGDPQLQVYVKQAHATDLRETLARALEFESFMASSGVMRRVAERDQSFRPGGAASGSSLQASFLGPVGSVSIKGI